MALSPSLSTGERSDGLFLHNPYRLNLTSSDASIPANACRKVGWFRKEDSWRAGATRKCGTGGVYIAWSSVALQWLARYLTTTRIVVVSSTCYLATWRYLQDSRLLSQPVMYSPGSSGCCGAELWDASERRGGSAADEPTTCLIRTSAILCSKRQRRDPPAIFCWWCQSL